MVIHANVPRTSGKKSEKNGVACHRLFSTMLVYCLHGLCAFPNMVIHANITRKSGKLRRKRRDVI